MSVTRHWKWAVVTLALLIVTNAVTAVTAGWIVRDDAQAAAPTIVTGGDPLNTECMKDVVTANSVVAAGGAFELKILYSTRCNAAWAKVTRTDHAGFGNRITVTIFRRSEPQGESRQFADEHDVDSAYTMVIVRQDPTDRLCATGSATNGSTEVTVEPPICL
ncbi:DUF2690 domain-containing protein [Nocardia bovistercoris]|uniref:DUF2690 domain-containing protein n=1 Tax=Nocardia bovistercoris TaxID=2785916 RepID=A0A931IKY1_9NOCA|nr:DUF2690 domain-containing protein [Nocardia bovistercoris]MBH0781413.1 DUF2690 domain-containing protein [Nocardia bovistercoris]